MSKDIDVFPSSPAIRTPGELTSELLQAQAASAIVRAAFDEEGVSDLSPLVELVDATPDRSTPVWSSDPALLPMPGHDYGWISLDTGKIGFDFSFSDDDPGFVQDYVPTDMAPRGASQPGLAGYPFGAAGADGDASGPCARKPLSRSRPACPPGSPPWPSPA